MSVVLKIGGSLLDLPDLRSRLERLTTSEFADSAVFVIVGGGLIVDAIRHYDSIHHLDTRRCHWLCVDLMSQSAHLLQQIVDWPLIDSAAELSSSSSTADPLLRSIVSPAAFYSPMINSTELPISWNTTSDSIAALLAKVVSAKELVMLKSTDESQAIDEPLLDGSFSSVVSPALTTRTINLRDAFWGDDFSPRG